MQDWVLRLVSGIEQVYCFGQVLGALTAAVEGLELPVDGATLVEALALWDRLGAKVASMAGQFDHHTLWDLDAATSLTGVRR